MAVQRKGKPYIWVTWLTKLMVGENSCEWNPWFRAHHERWSWEAVSAGAGLPSLAEWQMRHTEGIVQTRQSLEQDGWTVYTENQNFFRLAGESAVLGGKPDLIALRDEDGRVAGRIIDIKTGKPQPSHIAQVMLYQYAVPRALGQYRAVCFDGRLAYPDHMVEIPAEAVDQRFVDSLGELIRRVGASAPARRVPSEGECRFCDLPAEECAEKILEPVQVADGTTGDF